MNIENFKKIISNGIYVVDFYAEWCAPCKMLSPIFQEVETNFDNVASFMKMNIDNHMDIAQEYKITTIPTILIFKDGNIEDRIVGFNPKEVIELKLKKVINL